MPGVHVARTSSCRGHRSPGGAGDLAMCPVALRDVQILRGWGSGFRAAAGAGPEGAGRGAEVGPETTRAAFPGGRRLVGFDALMCHIRSCPTVRLRGGLVRDREQAREHGLGPLGLAIPSIIRERANARDGCFGHRDRGLTMNPGSTEHASGAGGSDGLSRQGGGGHGSHGLGVDRALRAWCVRTGGCRRRAELEVGLWW